MSAAARTLAGTAERDRGGKRIQPLSPLSINKTIDVLQMVLAQAVEYGYTTKPVTPPAPAATVAARPPDSA